MSNINKLLLKKISEIDDFDDKLDIFLRSLNEELVTWRDYEERGGKFVIPNPIAGFAALDGDNIIAITYFGHKKRNLFEYIFWLLFSERETETGAIVKKEYQRKGINRRFRDLKIEYMKELGYKRNIIRIDKTNIAAINGLEKSKTAIKSGEDDDAVYYFRDLTRK